MIMLPDPASQINRNSGVESLIGALKEVEVIH